MRKFIHQSAIISLAIFFFSFTAHSQENGVFSLEQCIETAWENNLQLRQQSLSVDLARQNLLQSRASVYPNFNASASHSYSFGRSLDPLTNDFITRNVQSNNFSVGSGVNLFSGFQTQNTIRQNRLELEAGTFDLERSYNDIALMVASAYLQILFNLELVEILSGQLEVTRQQVERTGKLVDAGTLPRGSLLTIQAQLATEELQLINAQNQLELSLLNLSQIMFLPDDTDLSIVVPDIEIAPNDETPYTPMQVYRVAVQQQPEVKSADLRIQSAERGLAVAKGGHSPQLSMRGSYGTGYSEAFIDFSGNSIPFADQLRENLSTTLGLTLSIPVFNNLQTRSSVSRSQINMENTRLQSQIVREQLFQTIQQAHADASAALKRFYATEKNLAALQEAFRYTEQRFNVGMVNTLEYNDAKNRLAAAESELLQSKYEYVFRIKILDFYLGEPLSF
ncbi:MAG: TolC family protein [Bacteroidetes bacterium]|nr:MAG: TolC family protein [Bacteroidota bacterium]